MGHPRCKAWVWEPCRAWVNIGQAVVWIMLLGGQHWSPWRSGLEWCRNPDGLRVRLDGMAKMGPDGMAKMGQDGMQAVEG